MAYTGSDRWRTQVEEAINPRKAFVPWWALVGEAIPIGPGVSSHRAWMDYGIGQADSWNGVSALTPQDVGALAYVDIALTGSGAWIAKAANVARADQITPEIVQSTLMGLLQSLDYAASKKPIDWLRAGVTDSYTYYTSPPGGATSTKTFFATNHTVTGGGTLTNKLTVALDADSLALAIQMIQRHRDYHGKYLNLGDGPFILIVPPELKDTASKITKSSTVVEYSTDADDSITATGANINPRSFEDFLIVVDKTASDTDDWGLIDVSLNTRMLRMCIEQDITVVIDDTQATTQQVTMSVSRRMNGSLAPRPVGIVWSSVTA